VAAADADPGLGRGPMGSLAQSGEGTLIHRFCQRAGDQRVRAKTSYLEGATARRRVISAGSATGSRC
jgi:hypothetical protein